MKNIKLYIDELENIKQVKNYFTDISVDITSLDCSIVNILSPSEISSNQNIIFLKDTDGISRMHIRLRQTKVLIQLSSKTKLSIFDRTLSKRRL